MLSFFVDTAIGDDGANGSAAAPWRTLERARVGTKGLTPEAGFTLNLSGNFDDDDPVVLDLDSISSNVLVQGAATVVVVVTVTSAQARAPLLNRANEITVDGFDWSPHVGRYVRLHGTITDGACIAADLGAGKARLGARPANLDGFTTGDVLEIVAGSRVAGLYVKGDILQVQARNLAFDPVASSAGIRMPAGCLFNPSRCMFGGPPMGFGTISAQSLAGKLNSWIRSEWDLNVDALASDESVFVDMNAQGLVLKTPGQVASRDALFQASLQAADLGVCHWNYKGALGIFDVPAGKVAITMASGNRLRVETILYGSGLPGSTCLSVAEDCYASLNGSPAVWSGGTQWSYLGLPHTWGDLPFEDASRLVAFQP